MTEMSMASEADQSSASEVSPSADTPQDALSPAVKGGIIFCGIVVGSCAIIILLALVGAISFDEDTDLDTNVNASMKVPPPGNDKPPVKPVPSVKSKTPQPGAEEPTTQPQVALPKEVKELVCTVGAAANMRNKYPTDGLCHDLYYTNVYIAGEAIRPTEMVHSYNWFKFIMKKYTATHGGLAFDYRYTTGAKIRHPDVHIQLKAFAEQNIPHAGILNLIARKDNMAGLMSKMKDVLEALKEFQGNDPGKKTIIAIGLFNYDQPGAWEMYKNWIKEATTYKADTVIAISSTITMDYGSVCKAAPPDALEADDKDFPDFKRHGELVAESTQYSNRKAVVGLSLEMGAQYYEMSSDVSNPENIPYRPCKYGIITGADIGCENGTHVKIPQSSNAVSRGWSKRAGILFDLNNTVEEKVAYIKNLPARRRFSWLYFDLHWADFRLECKQGHPFAKVYKLKEVFGIESQP